jgi:hypothetical protein
MKRFLLIGFSLVLVLGALGVWILLPSVTILLLGQPMTVVSVPFIEYSPNPSGSTSPDWPLVVLMGIVGLIGLILYKRRR